MTESENRKRLATILAMGRTRLGWSTREVAKKLGVTGASLNNWEAGKNWPTDRNLDALCVLYSLDYDDLSQLVTRNQCRDEHGRYLKGCNT